MTSPLDDLHALFDAAVQAVSADRCVPSHLPKPPRGRTVVVGAGKGAAAMARAVETHWNGPLSGLVVTRYGHKVPGGDGVIEVVEAGHPAPDAAGAQAAARILEMVRGLGSDDLVLALISGGGSSLLAGPAAGIDLADKKAVNNALLRSGAAIGEINTVRKHLSAIKGGRLAQAAAPARVVSLVLSDVPGDDPSVVASGPTVADPTTRQEALAILERHGIDIPPKVRAWLNDPASETPKPGEIGGEATVIATADDALAAATALAEARGLAVLSLGGSLEGESREVARDQAALVRGILRGEGPVAAPCVVLSGGETTVTVRGGGRGGRNAEYLLALALELEGEGRVHALAGDTDGIDGVEDNAGAVLDPQTLVRARAAGVDPLACLADNDSYRVFEAAGGLVFTGPTRTNVNDFRAILIS
jgi:hydroxypyruvate reductase